MTTPQNRIIVRLSALSSLILAIYLALVYVLSRQFGGVEFYKYLLVISGAYLASLIIVWIRERNLYNDYYLEKRVKSGMREYLLCPECQAIQLKGNEKCDKCGTDWIICRSCAVPFEKKSKILISPCCGEGFHYDHFVSELLELGHCSYCHSDIAVKTANW